MNKYLPILVFFILANVVGDNSILRVFGMQTPISALILSSGMILLQIFAAPIQAGFSDFYCRKKSLIVSLSFSFISVILLVYVKSMYSGTLVFLVLILLMNGLFGNTVPLAWAALADTQKTNLRFSLALSTGAYSIGYIVLAVSNLRSIRNIFSQFWISPDDILSTILFVLSVMLCILFFKDIRDKKIRCIYQDKKHEYLELAHREFRSLWKDVSCNSTRLGLLAYFLWATSQYSMLVFLTDFQIKYTSSVIVMMCGYLLGIIILGFCKKVKDEKMIKTAFIITIISLLLFFIINFFVKNNVIVIAGSYFFYSIGNAFLSPSMLSLFSKDRKTNEQGKGFGLIVSADSGGFLLASVFVIIFNYLNIKLEYIVLFSFIVFLVSWAPYSKYEKLRVDAFRSEN